MAMGARPIGYGNGQNAAGHNAAPVVGAGQYSLSGGGGGQQFNGAGGGQQFNGAGGGFPPNQNM